MFRNRWWGSCFKFLTLGRAHILWEFFGELRIPPGFHGTISSVTGNLVTRISSSELQMHRTSNVMWKPREVSHGVGPRATQSTWANLTARRHLQPPVLHLLHASIWSRILTRYQILLGSGEGLKSGTSLQWQLVKKRSLKREEAKDPRGAKLLPPPPHGCKVTAYSKMEQTNKGSINPFQVWGLHDLITLH